MHDRHGPKFIFVVDTRTILDQDNTLLLTTIL